MLRKILLVALVGVCFGSIFEHGLKFSPWRKRVHQFDIPKQEQKKESEIVGNRGDLMEKLRNDLLLKGQPMGGLSPSALLPLFGVKKPLNQPAEGHPMLMEGFSIKNCSDAAAKDYQFIIKTLEVKPDPLVLPGELTIAFDIIAADNLDNIMIALDLYKKVASTYIHIPCEGMFGSCTYDVCTLLDTVQQCPDKLVKNDIPCKCPYSKGEYKLPGITAPIGVPVFVLGDYNVTMNMKAGDKFVGCYNATFTIRS
ncbi:hypothetical protein ACOMHN_008171 [Nucella lapillus]